MARGADPLAVENGVMMRASTRLSGSAGVSVGSGGAGGIGCGSAQAGRSASGRSGPELIVGEVRRSAIVPGFAWREVLWRGASIGMLSELDEQRRVGVCRYPCMYRTPEAASDRGVARLLLAHRRSSAHSLVR